MTGSRGRRARSLAAGTRDTLTDGGFAAAWRMVRGLPEPAAARVFRAAADAAVRRDTRGVRQLRRNLRRVVGPSRPAAELEALVRDGMRRYARYWMETFRLPSMPVPDVLARTDIDGVAHLDAALASGRGAVVALPHMGNWDVAGVWLVDHGVRFTTVVERLRPAPLFDRFVAFRESLGFEVLPLTGGERSVSETLTARLTAGGCVCLVGDRDLSRRGVPVRFFGEPTRMPPGPALLAATTGAALLPVSLWFDGPRWAQHIGAPIRLSGAGLRDRVVGGTQALADVFAREIAARPADWHMLQRLWVADLDLDRRAALTASDQ